MKIKIILIVFLLGGLFQNCQKEVPNRDVVFFDNVESSVVKLVEVSAEADPNELSVISTDVVSKDLTVSIEVSEPKLDSYKAKYRGKNITLFPEGSYKLSSNTLIINAQSNKSNKVTLTFDAAVKLDQEATYCLPVTIKNISDPNLNIMEACRTIYFVRGSRQSVDLAGVNGFTVKSFLNDATLPTGPSTMECRFYVHEFPDPAQNPNGYWINLMGTRNGGSLILGTGGVIHSGDYWVGEVKYINYTQAVKLKTWNHVAVVYDGKDVSLYLNGKFESKVTTNGGATRGFSGGEYWGGFRIGGVGTSGKKSEYFNGCLSEVRVWRIARTADEIKRDMCSVSPYAEGLVAYWKMNLLTGSNTIKDLTGHNYDALPDLPQVQFAPAGTCP